VGEGIFATLGCSVMNCIVKKTELIAWRDMLVDVIEHIRSLSGKYDSLENILETGPTAAYDEQYGKGMLMNKQFVAMLYHEINRDW